MIKNIMKENSNQAPYSGWGKDLNEYRESNRPTKSWDEIKNEYKIG